MNNGTTLSSNLQHIADAVDTIRTTLDMPNDDIQDVANAVNVPVGTINITSNGITDVSNYAAANVNVAGSGGLDYSQFAIGLTTPDPTQYKYWVEAPNEGQGFRLAGNYECHTRIDLENKGTLVDTITTSYLEPGSITTSGWKILHYKDNKYVFYCDDCTGYDDNLTGYDFRNEYAYKLLYGERVGNSGGFSNIEILETPFNYPDTFTIIGDDLFVLRLYNGEYILYKINLLTKVGEQIGTLSIPQQNNYGIYGFYGIEDNINQYFYVLQIYNGGAATNASIVYTFTRNKSTGVVTSTSTQSTAFTAQSLSIRYFTNFNNHKYLVLHSYYSVSQIIVWTLPNDPSDVSNNIAKYNTGLSDALMLQSSDNNLYIIDNSNHLYLFNPATGLLSSINDYLFGAHPTEFRIRFLDTNNKRIYMSDYPYQDTWRGSTNIWLINQTSQSDDELLRPITGPEGTAKIYYVDYTQSISNYLSALENYDSTTDILIPTGIGNYGFEYTITIDIGDNSVMLAKSYTSDTTVKFIYKKQEYPVYISNGTAWEELNYENRW